MHTFVITRLSQSEDEEKQFLEMRPYFDKQKENGISLEITPLQIDKDTGEAKFLLANIFVDCLKFLRVENTTAADLQSIKKLLNDLLSVVGFSINDFKVSRVDYCHNVRIRDEAARQCLFAILQKCPTRGVYTTRKEDYPTSIYGKSKSRVINVYDKTAERHFKFQMTSNANNLPATYERDVIRMEFQIKKEHLKFRAKKGFDRTFDNWINADTERTYLQKLHGMFPRGDYWELSEAESKIATSDARNKMKERLIQFVRLIADKDMDAAKNQYSYNTYRKYITLLGEMNVNPITIPSEYGIKHIPTPFVFTAANKTAA